MISTIPPLDDKYQQYIQLLQQHGAKISPKLYCTFFKLKNGLPYPGLTTKQPILPHQLLVSIPTHMLLTAHKAQSDPELEQLLKDKFYHQGPIWQDRILVTYLLHRLRESEKSIWGEMVKNFSKEIDILSFWNDKQIQLFLDKSVIRAAKLERENFQNQWIQFQKIQHNYPILQDPSIFNYQNYKWVYTHAISRCFGSYMNSTYFTPFCQFFNHHCVDVSYSCIENQQKKQQIQDHNDSISSGNSQDYIQTGDYDYLDVKSYNINWCAKVCFDLKNHQTQALIKKIEQINEFMQKQINWTGFSLLYLGEIIQKTKIIENQYMAGRKKYSQALQELQFLFYHCNAYKTRVQKYFLNQHIAYRAKTVQKNTYQASSHEGSTSYSKSTIPPDKNYTQLIMQTHEQSFESYSEVYFCYGKLSNRTLLLRYGFCLEDNKYEHVWIKLIMSKHIGQYPDLFKKIQQKGLPITYKFKLRFHTLSTEMLTFFKMTEWKLYTTQAQKHDNDLETIFSITNIEQQTQLIHKILNIYEQELPKYGTVQSLSNENLTYHEYFIQLYHNEKIKIIQEQMRLWKVVLEIFVNLKEQQLPWKQYEKLIKVEKDKKKIHHYLRGLQYMM